MGCGFLDQVQEIRANAVAFAAILADGRVVTWGHEECGGDSSEVQDQLINVTHIQASHYAFAALRADGRVVSWGDPDSGGDSSLVQGELRNVQQLQSTHYSFAAIKADGTVPGFKPFKQRQQQIGQSSPFFQTVPFFSRFLPQTKWADFFSTSKLTTRL